MLKSCMTSIGATVVLWLLSLFVEYLLTTECGDGLLKTWIWRHSWWSIRKHIFVGGDTFPACNVVNCHCSNTIKVRSLRVERCRLNSLTDFHPIIWTTGVSTKTFGDLIKAISRLAMIPGTKGQIKFNVPIDPYYNSRSLPPEKQQIVGSVL